MALLSLYVAADPFYVLNVEENTNLGFQDQTLSSLCSEDEYNSSHELCRGESTCLSQNNSTTPNLSGKLKSSREPASNLQSIYQHFGRKTLNQVIYS